MCRSTVDYRWGAAMLIAFATTALAENGCLGLDNAAAEAEGLWSPLCQQIFAETKTKDVSVPQSVPDDW
jgi:hypothetical protein